MQDIVLLDMPAENIIRKNNQILRKELQNPDDLNAKLEKFSLNEILNWCITTFGEKLAQVTSFGPTGVVLLDHLIRLQPTSNIITIDTEYLFEETYHLIERIQDYYNIQVQIHKPQYPLRGETNDYTPSLAKKDPDSCCEFRKIQPLQGALIGLDAWMTGLRRDQSSKRSMIPIIMWDKKHQIAKINPLANWSKQQVWNYIFRRDLPYNRLHDQGYASIGCTYCTLPTHNLTDERSGRWSGISKTECGIHLTEIPLTASRRN